MRPVTYIGEALATLRKRNRAARLDGCRVDALTIDADCLNATKPSPGTAAATTAVPVKPGKAARDPAIEIEAFHRLWKDLHGWALDARPEDPGRWLAAFGARVPCGECRAFWRSIMIITPPPTAWIEMFDWTVAVHNAVNRKLGKPEISVNDAARAMSKERIPADRREPDPAAQTAGLIEAASNAARSTTEEPSKEPGR